jgi:hypothetical protein
VCRARRLSWLAASRRRPQPLASTAAVRPMRVALGGRLRLAARRFALAAPCATYIAVDACSRQIPATGCAATRHDVSRHSHDAACDKRGAHRGAACASD